MSIKVTRVKDKQLPIRVSLNGGRVQKFTEPAALELQRKLLEAVRVKLCPKCDDGRLQMLDADNDICSKCKHVENCC